MPQTKLVCMGWAGFVGYSTWQLVQMAYPFQGTRTILPGRPSSLMSCGYLGKPKET